VYAKIKHNLLMLITLSLWARGLVMIYDPYWGGIPLEQGLALFRDWRPLWDWLYFFTGYLMLPIYTLYGLLAPFLPTVDWFPGVPTAQLYQTLLTQAAQIAQAQPSLAFLPGALQSPVVGQAMVGYIDWLVIAGVLFYNLLSPVVDRLYEFLKNLIWNVLIEFSFSKRKEARYQEALESAPPI